MKILWTFLLCIPLLAQCRSNLIFVHLGGEPPMCMYTAIKQARFFNPECSIFLLGDQSSYPLFDADFAQVEDIALINGDELICTKEHKIFRQLVKAEFDEPNGYLFYTLDRFFYLFDWMQEHKVEDLFHLENDTMLYVELDELMPMLDRCDARMAAPFLSAVAAVPCFVYVRDTDSFRSFIDYTISWAGQFRGKKAYLSVTDMKCLAYFYRDFGEKRLTQLPTLMPEYVKQERKRLSLQSTDNRTTLDFLCANSDLFSGYLFDGATLGVFANGNDRRIHPASQPGAIHFRALFNPRHFRLDWSRDQKNRPIPRLSYRGNRYAIANLHLHSKLLDGFASYAEKRAEFP